MNNPHAEAYFKALRDNYFGEEAEQQRQLFNQYEMMKHLTMEAVQTVQKNKTEGRKSDV